ncbi:MAG: hypothetical protein AB7N91_32205 [Candidatus Tectimicrobiota bacterium]
MTSPDSPDESEELPARPLTPEEVYYQEFATKEPVDSLARLDDIAKFLIGASATTSGLFVAVYKLTLGKKETVPGPAGFAPFLLWAASILALLCVVAPQQYVTGKNTPASWRHAVLQARARKYRWLWIGAWLFILGIVTAVYPLVK